MNERTTLEKIAPTVEEAIAEGWPNLTAEKMWMWKCWIMAAAVSSALAAARRVRLTVKVTPIAGG